MGFRGSPGSVAIVGVPSCTHGEASPSSWDAVHTAPNGDGLLTSLLAEIAGEGPVWMIAKAEGVSRSRLWGCLAVYTAKRLHRSGMLYTWLSKGDGFSIWSGAGDGRLTTKKADE